MWRRYESWRRRHIWVSLSLVLFLAPRGFFLVVRFSPLLKNHYLQIPIRSGKVDKEPLSWCATSKLSYIYIYFIYFTSLYFPIIIASCKRVSINWPVEKLFFRTFDNACDLITKSSKEIFTQSSTRWNSGAAGVGISRSNKAANPNKELLNYHQY